MKLLIITLRGILLSACLVAFPVHAEQESARAYTLEDCYSRALKNNPLILAALAQYNRQGGQRTAARSNFFPDLAAEGEVSSGDDSRIDSTIEDGTDTGKWQSKLEITQPLYRGGKIQATYEKSKYLEEAAAVRLEAVENRVLLQSGALFFNALRAKQLRSIQESLISLLEREVSFRKKAFGAGDSARFEVLRAQVALANAKPALFEATREYEELLAELSAVLGETDNPYPLPSADLVLSGELRYEPFQISLADARERARKGRPEITRSKLLVQAAKKEIATQRARLLPDVSLFANYSHESLDEDFSREEDDWRIGVRARWLIFDSFETKGLVKSAHSERFERLAQQRNALLEADAEVEKNYARLQAARKRYETAKAIVSTAAESLKLAEMRAEAGEGIQLDVLQAQEALTSARQNEIRAVSEHSIASLAMKKAMGVIGAEVKAQLRQRHITNP